MRPAATLAHAAGSLETHAPAELAPMSRIQVAEVSMDRHASRDLAQWGSKWPQILYQNLNWGFPGQPRKVLSSTSMSLTTIETTPDANIVRVTSWDLQLAEGIRAQHCLRFSVPRRESPSP